MASNRSRSFIVLDDERDVIMLGEGSDDLEVIASGKF